MSTEHEQPQPGVTVDDDVYRRVAEAAQRQLAAIPEWVKRAYAHEAARFAEMGEVARHGR